jgi:hypothetical protein
MPMPFTRLDVHDIANRDLTLLFVVCHRTPSRSYHQNLVAIVSVPPGGCALAEVDDVTPEILRIREQVLPRPWAFPLTLKF